MSRRLSRLGRAFCPQPRRPSARPPRALHGGVGPPPDQRSLLSSGASRTASLTFARSRRSSDLSRPGAAGRATPLGREFNASEVPKLLCTGADEPPLLQRELENA